MATNINMLNKLSWRDPDGFVVKKDGRIFRAVHASKVADTRALLSQAWYRKGVADGWFPESTWVDGSVDQLVDTNELSWLEHRALAFPCYPHEITALQLYDAAKLTLAIARVALEHGWIIKDASAWNVLFEHGKPRFCDILSFERVDTSGIWIAYAQFFRHFVIPLLLYRHADIQTSHLFQLHRDGVQPDQARRMLSGWRAYVQPALEAVTIPAWFGRVEPRTGKAEAGKSRPAELAQYLLNRTLTRLDKHLDRVKPAGTAKPSKWENYEGDRDHYTARDVAAKSAFVRVAVDVPDIGTVLDLGCNAGEFSKIAAHAGKTVLAADYDHGALSRLYGQLRATDLQISAVLLDIGRPTPAVGWMNREVDSFMQRAKGGFDCIMALGLVHHLLVSERAGLPMILEFFRELAPKYLVLEWVAPEDRRFSEIAGVNQALYADTSQAGFEHVFGEQFDIVNKEMLACGTRTLYLLKAKSAA